MKPSIPGMAAFVSPRSELSGIEMFRGALISDLFSCESEPSGGHATLPERVRQRSTRPSNQACHALLR
jgi:hypothetical protein